MKKIICFETVRFSALFLQMQTLFSERADEAVDMRDADRDTMLHMWNYALCTDMRWWELFSKSTSWLSAARLEGRVGREVESELQTGTVSPRPRDLGQAVTSSTRQGWRSFPWRLKWEHQAVRDSQHLWQWRTFPFLETSKAENGLTAPVINNSQIWNPFVPSALQLFPSFAPAFTVIDPATRKMRGGGREGEGAFSFC